MRSINIGGIPIALGEVINFKYHLDLIRNQYDQIRLNFYTPLFEHGLNTHATDWPHKKQLWEKYLSDIGILFFSEPPFLLEKKSSAFCGDIRGLIEKLNMRPQKAELGNLLCKGAPLNIGEYIVITTKVREFQRQHFDQIATSFWSVIKPLSSKYKIVILGEKKVEMRKEYERLRIRPFGIYDDIINNLPQDRMIDLTIPALGETVADLKQIQQDCLIMKEAKCVISFGIGGNHCLSTAVSNMAIGYRTDNWEYNNTIFEYKEYPNAIITKNSDRFISALKYYL